MSRFFKSQISNRVNSNQLKISDYAIYNKIIAIKLIDCLVKPAHSISADYCKLFYD